MKPASSTSASSTRNSTNSAVCSPPAPMAVTIKSSGTTARSWAISTAVVSRPASPDFSSASSTIFMATAVDEIASMKPMTMALRVSLPSHARPASPARW